MSRFAPHTACVFAALLYTSTLVAQEAETRSPHGPLPPTLTCTMCHTSEGWEPRIQGFDHNQATSFPLRDRHRDVACGACHLNGKFNEPQATPSECGVCHADVHQGQLSSDCATCHSPTSFDDVPSLQIHARSGFPLTGAHLQVTCDACHPGDERGVLAVQDAACVACHESDYRNATALDHVANNLPTDCERCHSTLAWTFGVRFDHVTASGGFPLLGRHAEIRCSSCHEPGTMAPLFATTDANDCYGCHQPDWQRAHGGAFPTTCTDCHTVDGWAGATFDHNTVNFPLVGAHLDLECAKCHTVPGFGPLFTAPSSPDDCVACHRPDYQREHAGTGFPTTCLLCHNVDRWNDASFRDHDSQYFPIYSGAHRGRWSGCLDCHTNAQDFGLFSCTTCHEQATTDSHHREVSNYLYESTACYSCHPDGRSGD